MKITNDRLLEIQCGDYARVTESIELAKQLLVARSILSEWSQKKGQALCQLHPEILQRLAHALEVPVPEIETVSEPEMKLACDAYRDFLYRKDKQ